MRMPSKLEITEGNEMGILPDESDLTFTFRVVPGVSLSSYGLHCARLAGLPASVIRDAFDMMRHEDEIGAHSSTGEVCHFEKKYTN